MVKNGCAQSGHGTLKLTVSQEWVDWMNWLFTCRCKFRKAKSYCTDFWVGMVKNGVAIYLIHGTLKFAVSYKWVYELNYFFACWLWCNNFWLDQHLSFTFNYQSTAVVLARPPAVALRILWNRFCPSFCPAVCLGIFLELYH